jgi:hypothetical protein
MSDIATAIKKTIKPTASTTAGPSASASASTSVMTEEQWQIIYDYMEANHLSSYSNRLDCVRDEDPGEFPYTLVKVKPVNISKK